VPTLVLDLALFAPRREVGAYASFKKLASGGVVYIHSGMSPPAMGREIESHYGILKVVALKTKNTRLE
jgi:hypothetical protein